MELRTYFKELSGVDDERDYLGLYCSYDGNYACVYSVSVSVSNDGSEGQKVLTYFYINNPGQSYSMLAVDFFSDTYVSLRDGRKELIKPVLFHPFNTTGQKALFEKVVNIEDRYKDFTTEHLVEELKKRKDNPLAGLDVEGLSDSVEYVDFILGKKKSDKYGEYMEVFDHFDTEKELLRHMSKKSVYEPYKRVWSKLR